MGPAHSTSAMCCATGASLDAAEAAYRRALALMPEHAVLHMNLGNLLRRLDRLDEAIARHRRAALEPQRHEARFNLANALAAAGERDEAAHCYREVLAARPDFADATANLAALLLSDRAGAEADGLIAGLLARDPRSRAALMLLARRRMFGSAGRKRKTRCAARSRQARPMTPRRTSCAGSACFAWATPRGAVEAYRRALAITRTTSPPSTASGCRCRRWGISARRARLCARPRVGGPRTAISETNLGSVSARAARSMNIALLRKSTLDLDPGATAFSNLGHALFLIGHLSEAVTAARRRSASPGYADASSNLGTALGNQGRLANAVAAFERALALDPDHGQSFSNLLFLGNYDPDISAAALAELHRGFGRRHENAAVARHEVDRDPGRRLRVGYVSPDLRQHSVAYFTEPLLAAHDPDAVEVTCCAAVKRDDVTEGLQSCAGARRNILGMSDAAAADCIRADRIDILVDLRAYRRQPPRRLRTQAGAGAGNLYRLSQHDRPHPRRLSPDRCRRRSAWGRTRASTPKNSTGCPLLPRLSAAAGRRRRSRRARLGGGAHGRSARSTRSPR